jgi:hypothetical protein
VFSKTPSGLQSNPHSETQEFMGSEAYLASQTLQEDSVMKTSSFSDTALFLASSRLSWLFYTSTGTGAVYGEPEEQVIEIKLDLVPLYVMMGFLCALHVSLLMFLIWDKRCNSAVPIEEDFTVTHVFHTTEEDTGAEYVQNVEPLKQLEDSHHEEEEFADETFELPESEHEPNLDEFQNEIEVTVKSMLKD